MRVRILPCVLASAASVWVFPAAAQDAGAPACGAANIVLRPVAATHTIPPYPAISQMMGEEGTSVLKVTIMPDGTVSDDAVEHTSGSMRLDDAAIVYVKQNWRWAVSGKDCTPAPSQTLISIVWNLRSQTQAITPFTDMTLDAADYPADARAKQEQGVVGILLLLSETGAIVQARVASSSGFTDLDNKALEIAQTRWHWAAAQMSGKPVKSAIELALHWTLGPPPRN